MAGVIGRTLTVGALVLGLPAACFAGFLFYGKQLADSEVAEGTLVSPEERRAQIEEAARIFRAMTPAEHLAAAREGISRAAAGDGSLVGVERHLAAIPEEAPEHAQIQALRDELARRREAVFAEASSVVASQIREHGDAARADDAARRGLRAGLAAALDHMASHGLGCVHVGGRDGAVLRFDTPSCDAAMVARIVRPESMPGLRAFGFRKVRCRNRQATLDLEPDASP